jgi:hypothetical protein
MSKNTLRAGTSRFAHLMPAFLGRGSRAEEGDDTEAREARRAEEDERRKDEDARRAEEDEKRKEEDALRAEEDDDSGDDEDDKEKEKDKGKKGKKAKSAEDDDASDGDDDGDMKDEASKAAYREGLAAGRERENDRCARIFSSKAAAGRPDLAATLAFTTRNSSAEALAILDAAGPVVAPRGRSLDDRMGKRSDPRPGAETPGKGAGGGTLAEKMIAVGKKLGQTG